MKHLIKARPSPAMVVALIALFVSLGGTAAALSGSDTVQSDDLGPGAQVMAPDVAANAVNGSDVVDNSIAGPDVNEAGLDATPLRTRVAQGGCSPSVAGTGVMVKVGPVCIDRYEVSVWSSPTGGTRYGASSDNYPCNDNGQNCDNIYARSVAGVTPSRFITYFQAQRALANSGKRLPTNAEWQMAVAGTPNSTGCNVDPGGAVANTGANTGCVSDYGANDMVGNLAEWVSDWDEEGFGGDCSSWPSSFGDDLTCIGRGSGETSTRFPGAMVRGGGFFIAGGSGAGPFQVTTISQPANSDALIGFRGAR
jgi:formylglycine-generating enzyme required for sulfatase activity